MAPTEHWKKFKKIIVEMDSAVKNLKSLDPKSLKNVRNDYGKGLLHVAAEHGFLDISKYLIEIGCEVNLRDQKHGSTPLSCAFKCNDRKIRGIVDLLVKSGADLSWKDIQNQSKLLFDEKRNITNTLCTALKDREGSFQAAADHLLAKGWTFENVARLRNDKITKCALKRNPNLDTNHKKLLNAVTVGDVIQVKELLDHVACSQRVMSWALLEAARTRSLESPMIIKLLFDYGAPVHGFDTEKRTPIIEALIHRNVDNIWILLNYGAKLEKTEVEELLHIPYNRFKELTEIDKGIERVFAKNCIRLLIEYSGVCNFDNSKLEIVKCLIDFYRVKFDISVSYHICTEYKLMQRHLMEQDHSDIMDNFNCSGELKRLKNLKIEECMSIWELLKKTLDETVPLSRNKSLLDEILSVNFVDRFPLYGKTLQFKVKKAFERSSQIDHSIDVLSMSLPFIGSCKPALEKIADYLGISSLLDLE